MPACYLVGFKREALQPVIHSYDCTEDPKREKGNEETDRAPAMIPTPYFALKQQIAALAGQEIVQCFFADSISLANFLGF